MNDVGFAKLACQEIQLELLIITKNSYTYIKVLQASFSLSQFQTTFV